MYYYDQDIIDTNKVDIYELFSPNQVFNVICYHINDKSGLYPFVQFLLCKDKYSNKFTMPQSNKEDLITNIKASLLSMGILEEYIDVNKIVFKGYYKDKVKQSLTNNKSDYLQSFSLLVDISGIDLSKLLLVNTNPAWFGLYSEIINEKSICNIPISDIVVNYFESNTCLAKIYADNVDKMIYYPIPSVVYTVDEFKRVEFKGLFGESKVENKDYYYFHKSFNNAVNSSLNNSSFSSICLTSNTSSSYKKGVNRYALFSEKSKNLEDINDLDLDNYSSNFYNGSIFATQYEQHVPISYHILANLKEYNIM